MLTLRTPHLSLPEPPQRARDLRHGQEEATEEHLGDEGQRSQLHRLVY